MVVISAKEQAFVYLRSDTWLVELTQDAHESVSWTDAS